MLIDPEHFVSFSFRNEKIIWLVGLVVIALTIPCLFYLFKRLFGDNIALILDGKGITDNSSANSIGFIPWDDVENIKSIKVASTNFLLIELRDPKKYILKSKNIFITRIMKMNLKYYGSPVILSSNSIESNFNDLQRNVIAYFNEWRINNKTN